MSTWLEVLDVLEERVRRLEAVARGNGAPLSVTTDLVADGPLPVELVPRAHALLARARAAESVARDTLARSHRQYAALRRR